MKLRLFGKEADIRTEAVITGISVLALLGMLIGYIFFRDTGDIIIEATGDHQDQADAGGAMQVTGDGGEDHRAATGKPQAGIKPGNNNSGGSTPGNNTPENGNPENSTSGNGTPENLPNNDEGKLKIYVVGCVRKPGIVALEKGSMICDAVSKAGGLTEDADSDNINMVYSLNENVMLYIKSKKEESSGFGKGAVIICDSGSGAEVIGKGDDTAAGTDRVALVNINTAGTDELDTLPGIGEATARDIIAYRDKYGGFGSIEDIMKVPRIKENRFESIRDYITVE